MRTVAQKVITPLVFAVIACDVASAQFGREAVWMTAGSNAQRSSWVRADASIARDKIAGEFQFLWKVQLDKPGFGSPAEPILMERYIGYRGFRSLAFMGTMAGGVYAVDTDLNRIEWQQHVAAGKQQQSSANCAASLGTSLTLPTTGEFPSGLAGGGFGRGGAAKSGVGEPYQGAVTLAPAEATVPRLPVRPAGAQRPSFTRSPIVLDTVTSDGLFHELYVSNGEESTTPVRFVPPTSLVRGFIVVNQTAYAVAGESCGSRDQVFALDLATKEVSQWAAEGATIAGADGAAIGPDGTVYVATGKGGSTYGSSVVALDGKTLKPKDWYTVTESEFTSTPVVMQYKNRTFIAAASRDGHLHILDSKSLGGESHKTALVKTADSPGQKDFAPGALAVWQDAQLTHWLLAASSANDGSIVAWKLVDDEHGAPVLERGWASGKIKSPAAPLVINGVAFTTSNSHSETGRRSSPSVLYALDGATGRELWNSKESMSSSAVKLSAGAGRVYVTTADGSLYAFGFPMEH